MKKQIIKYKNPLLKKKSKPVGKVTPEILQLIEDMKETMYAAPGVGLAAVQVGEALRIATIDASNTKDQFMVLINPEIIDKSGEIESEEGCLSVPGLMGIVKRAAKVKVRAMDINGKTFEVEGEGMLSRVFQHEIDHMNGTLFVEKVEKGRLFPTETEKGL
jgi:peptide deformylase